MSILFVTGTDTGVGKTTITAALLNRLRQTGVDVGAIKPIETGCRRLADGTLVGSDIELLSKSLGTPALNVYLFESPVAPQAAARIEKREIEIDRIVSEIKGFEAKHSLCLLEGAGGLLVPIAEGKTFADLAEKCEAHCLIVVGSRLGALNHAALTFEAVKTRKLPILGYVLNDLFPATNPEQSVALQTNRALVSEIADSYGIKEIAHLPYREMENRDFYSNTDGAKAIEQLSGAVIEYFQVSL